ncbi:rhamnogalacturonan lyase [Cellvibrio sp. NN19]|uniref:rhamnogalacturonan lyase n=1 Tax=Cellvibrio chitinivorans TaxID=3102792 RepID=UPI002B400D6D|nr:rhamnogalacturonan lyase [Cellvibrio sp. NN19]
MPQAQAHQKLDCSKTKRPCTEKKTVENLDRGLVVIPTEEGNAISWRLLQKDPPHKGFHLFRNGKKLNKHPLTQATFFIDKEGKADDSYEVMIEGEHHLDKEKSNAVKAWNKPYLSIPLNKPKSDSIFGVPHNYSANDASVADLDGDGDYEVIVKWYPSNAKDNSQSGYTGNVFIDAYTLEGQQLWRINLGKNIRAGAHYTQFIAYDFDGDGRAEVAMKTADGTIDGRGTVIGNASADYRNSAGYVLTGPEYLTMFDGLSGEALDTIDYVPARGNIGDWGDTYGNRVDRFLAGVAYLNGETPSLLMARGYYTRAVVAAFDWVNGKFSERWVFDTNNGNGDEVVYGQGAHSLSVADVDNDGRDEIIYGAATIDDNGHALYSTALGHGDALHVTDIDPNRPGLEVFMVHECASCYTKDGVEYGVELHDAATGQILWSQPSNGADVGRGVSIDIDPRFAGNENWGSRGGLVAANGQLISDVRPPQMNFALWWDGDLLREILDGNKIYKWDYENSVSNVIVDGELFNAVSANGTKATPALSADIFGDWREEVIWSRADSSELMIFSSPIATTHRIPTLMQNPQYRAAIAWQNVGYNQPPHPSFYLGSDMQAVPDYQVTEVDAAPWAKLVARGDATKIAIQLYSHDAKFNGADIFREVENDPASKIRIGRIKGAQGEIVDTNVVPDINYIYSAQLRGGKPHTQLNPGASKTQLSMSLIPQVEFNITNNKVPVQLTWRTENMDIRAINIYREEVADDSVPANFANSQFIGNAANDAITWQDASATASKNYYYWVEFDNGLTNSVIRTQPVYVATILEPKTNLVSSKVANGISLNWKLQDFASIRTVEVYRNTLNQASGRTRVLASAPQEGSLVDTNVVAGTTYWYMFKLTMSDGTTVNTTPEASITF